MALNRSLWDCFQVLRQGTIEPWLAERGWRPLNILVRKTAALPRSSRGTKWCPQCPRTPRKGFTNLLSYWASTDTRLQKENGPERRGAVFRVFRILRGLFQSKPTWCSATRSRAHQEEEEEAERLREDIPTSRYYSGEAHGGHVIASKHLDKIG